MQTYLQVHKTFRQKMVRCGIDIYAATMSDPDKLYFGKYKGKRLDTFNGREGYWIVWDDGEMNAARLVIDENGKPAGFIPRMFPDGFVYGYIRNEDM